MIHRARRWLDVALIALVIAALGAPGLIALVRPNDPERIRDELRLPAAVPELAWGADEIRRFPARFESWFNDAYGLRNELLHAYNYERVFAFGVSPTNKLVVGLDRWLYLCEANAIPVYRGLSPLSSGKLNAWRRGLESRRDWCARNGIGFLYAIVPEKSAIYPERLPRAINQVGPTRLDQLLAHLRANSTLEVLDLRPALCAEKAYDRDGDYAYFPLGTHWTDRGVWAGYRAILERLRGRLPTLAPIEREDLGWRLADNQGDSWAWRLHLGDDLFQPSWEAVGVREPHYVASVQDGLQVVAEQADQRLPTIVLFHDSFGESLRRFISSSFSRSVCVWYDVFDTALIEAEKPDFVVQLFAERSLVGHSPTLVAAADDRGLREDFERSREVLLAIDATEVPGRLEPLEKTVLAKTDDGIAVTTSTLKDTLVLPAVECPANATLVLKIETTCTRALPVLILYTTRAEHAYQRHNNYNLLLREGRTASYFEMLDPTISGKMMLRVGGGAERFLLHALEIRAVRRP